MSTPNRKANSPVSIWREKDQVKGKAVDAGVVILRTAGCRHFKEGGCTMCSYNLESSARVEPQDILTQFDQAMVTLGDVDMIKVYTSGSFLDDCEIPPDVLDHILRFCAERDSRLLFESRPEFISDARIDKIVEAHDNIEVALGLESSNDLVLKHSINKGFERKDYDRAAGVLHQRQVPIRTYVLLKPPFLTEAEAIADSIATIGYAARVSETVSLNPVNVQKGTLVERLWRSWAYRPPWLWSVLEVLKSSSGRTHRLVCEPTGGGRERGAHNCGRCDDVILSSIKAFSESQDPHRLGWPECSCRDVWSGVKEIEGYAMGGLCDLQKLTRRARA